MFQNLQSYKKGFNYLQHIHDFQYYLQCPNNRKARLLKVMWVNKQKRDAIKFMDYVKQTNKTPTSYGSYISYTFLSTSEKRPQFKEEIRCA